MHQSHRDLLNSPEFHRLLARRWRVSLILSALLFVLYYGYILLIAVNRQALSRTMGGAPGGMTVGIPIGAAVIVGAVVLTAVYVIWANRHYDPEADRLRKRLHGH